MRHASDCLAEKSTPPASRLETANWSRSYALSTVTIAFVGDGINDSIPLASSDLAISLESGTDAAVSLAQIVLLGSDIRRGISVTLNVACIHNPHIIAAIAWCGAYFVFAILLAGGAFVNWRISPSYAGLGALVSVVTVLLIAADSWL